MKVWRVLFAICVLGASTAAMASDIEFRSVNGDYVVTVPSWEIGDFIDVHITNKRGRNEISQDATLRFREREGRVETYTIRTRALTRAVPLMSGGTATIPSYQVGTRREKVREAYRLTYKIERDSDDDSIVRAYMDIETVGYSSIDATVGYSNIDRVYIIE